MDRNSENIDVIPTRSAPIDPSRCLSERDTLVSFLDYYRRVLVRKCAGLTSRQLQATTANSTLTLGGLLRHMALVEDHWFQHTFLGRELPDLWLTADWDAQPDWEMDTAPEFSPTELARQFDDAVARSDAAISDVEPDRIAAREDHRGPTDLRWILVHMVEEYARHCGHADLLRESIDGTVGD